MAEQPDGSSENVSLLLLFDFGGVVTESPFQLVHNYTRHLMHCAFERAKVAVPKDIGRCDNFFFDALRLMNHSRSLTAAVGGASVVKSRGVFGAFEAGYIPRSDFVRAFNTGLRTFCAMIHAGRPRGPTQDDKEPLELARHYSRFLGHGVLNQLSPLLDAECFLAIFERPPLRRDVLEAINLARVKLSEEGVKLVTGILTNNWQPIGFPVATPPGKEEPSYDFLMSDQGADDEFRSLLRAYMPFSPGGESATTDPNASFDFIVQSVAFRFRKPESNIYRRAMEVALQKLGGGVARFTHAVYFDDMTSNCKAAVRTGLFDSVVRVPRVSTQPVVQAIVKSVFDASGKALRLTLEGVMGAVPPHGLLYRPPTPAPTIGPVPPPQRFTEAEVARLLRHLERAVPHCFPAPQIAGASGPFAVEYFKGGMSNPTFRLTNAVGSFVLRKQPKGVLLKGAHNMKREVELLRYLEKNSKVPVPEVVLFCDDKTVLGCDFYVMHYLYGEIFWDVADLTRGQRNPEAYFSAMVDVAIDLHATPLPHFLAAKPVTELKETPLWRLVGIWDRQYKAANESLQGIGTAFLVPEFEDLSGRLQAVLQSGKVPFPEKLTLTHGDFKPDNMAFEPLGTRGRRAAPGELPKPVMIGLLDFELATVGDPLTDVAYLCIFHLLPPPKGAKGSRLAQKYPSTATILHRYCEKTGALASLSEPQRREIFNVYLAVMCHKLCGIVHGVACRAMKGNASDITGGLKTKVLCAQLAREGLQLVPSPSTPVAKL